MATEEINAGDVVWLKSGSPKMSVQSVEKDGRVHVSWFIQTKAEHGVYQKVSLTKDNPGTGAPEIFVG